MLDIPLCSGEEIIDAENLMPISKQPIAEMRAQEAGSTRNQNRLPRSHLWTSPFSCFCRGEERDVRLFLNET